ncbi:MAG TPA: hypothetical protein VIK28_00750 [Sedimentisphaerales bacterium]
MSQTNKYNAEQRGGEKFTAQKIQVPPVCNAPQSTPEFCRLSQHNKKAVHYMVVVRNKPKLKTLTESKLYYQKFLNFWELFPFILPAKTRREVYEPAYNDLLADYDKALQFKSPWARRWLTFCFTCRTIFMVVDSLRVLTGSKFRKVVWNSITESFRKGVKP